MRELQNLGKQETPQEERLRDRLRVMKRLFLLMIGQIPSMGPQLVERLARESLNPKPHLGPELVERLDWPGRVDS